MVADQDIDFQRYLQSLCDDDKYRDWQECYTPTDALEQPKKGRRRLDLGLMVQTIPPLQPEGQGLDREKTERLNVLEGLRKYAADHVLLKGRPGSGKSTALERLLWEEAENGIGREEETKIPVLVELRGYGTSVLDLMRDFFIQHGLNLKSAEIENLLFAGRFLLLIDGLNELPNEDARRDLDNFRKKYRRVTPMIFTTRDLGVDLGIEKKLEMQPLTEVQMQQFVRAYLPEMGEEMLRRLGGRLRELGETPLFLWMLCEVFEELGEIPATLGSLFRWFSGEYDKLKQDVPISEGLRNWQSELLQQLAFVMMQGDSRTELRLNISKQQARNVLAEFLQGKVAYPDDCARRWLEDLLKYHLIQLRTDEQIEFRHQLLQEYSAGERLLQLLPQISDERLKRDYLNYLKWTEPLALMLALVDDESQAVRVVRLALNVDLMLGARLAGEVKSEFQEKIIGLVNAQKLQNGQNVPDWLKIQLLGKTRSQMAITLLQKFLQHPNSDIRRASIWVLRHIDCDDAVILVLLKSLEHPDSGVRQMAIRVLAEFNCQKAIPNLIQALDDPEVDVRYHAICALEKLGGELVIPGLLKALIDLDHNVRVSAEYFLVQRMSRELVIPTLIDALNSPENYTRRDAAKILGDIGDESCITKLYLLVFLDIDLEVKLAAWYAIYKLNNPNLVINKRNVKGNKQELQKSDTRIKILLKNLEHSNPDFRNNALIELPDLAAKEAISIIINLIEDSFDIVRYNAITKIGGLFNKFPEVQKHIENAIPKLIESLKDSYPNVRSTAAITLGLINGKSAIPELIQTLKDSEPNVRSCAAQALGKLNCEQTVPALLEALENPNENEIVRDSIGDAISSIRGNATAQLLPNLIMLIPTQLGQLAIRTILGIQENCKFYNHEIFHSPPIVEDKPSEPLLDILNKLNKTMSETPKNDFTGASFGNIIGSVTGNIQGDNIGTQNNYPAAENIAEVEKLLQKLLEQIEQTKPTPIEAQLIVEQAVEKHPVLKDGQIIEQAIKRYPPLKVRLQRVVTAAGIETVKVLFAPAGIAIEAIRAWTQPE